MNERELARAAARQFALGGEVAGLERQPGGHINQSWRVSVAGAGAARRYLLQRINSHVFPQPELVMDNVARVTNHLAGAITLVPTHHGKQWLSDDSGVWRVFPFIEHVVARQHANTAAEAEAAGYAYGRFQQQLASLPGPRLHEMIPGFHDTPARVTALERAVAEDRCGRVTNVRAEIESLLARHHLAHALDGAGPERIVHNDAKFANLLLNDAGQVVAIVDLDTVMPGLPLHDYGDLVRSIASGLPEDWLGEQVIRTDLVEGAARGYLRGAGDLLSDGERELLPVAARVITYEQAVRFLTDYLEGDHYFRTERPGHNLDRARAQARLLIALGG